MMKLMKHIAILAAVASASLVMAEGPDGRGEHRGRGLRTSESRTAPTARRGGEDRIARLEAMVHQLVGEVRSLRVELAKTKSAPSAKLTYHGRSSGIDRAPAKKSYEAHRAEMMKRIHEKMAAMKKGPQHGATKKGPHSDVRVEVMGGGKFSPDMMKQAHGKLVAAMKAKGIQLSPEMMKKIHGKLVGAMKNDKAPQKYSVETLKRMLMAAKASPQARERVIAAAKKDPILAKKLGWMKQQMAKAHSQAPQAAPQGCPRCGHGKQQTTFQRGPQTHGKPSPEMMKLMQHHLEMMQKMRGEHKDREEHGRSQMMNRPSPEQIEKFRNAMRERFEKMRGQREEHGRKDKKNDDDDDEDDDDDDDKRKRGRGHGRRR